jgi:tetratricopeptide (TPR) repeat protein
MPEKTTIAEIPRNLRELYEKGNAALQKNNFDYAIAIYNQILSSEPAFYPCREALRACQFKKAGQSSGFFKKVFGTASASPQLAKAQIQLRNNPTDALATCEQILNSDPNNNPAHRILADAALALDYPKTAVLSLEIVFRNNPRDIDAALKLGEALNAAGQIDRAHKVYSELQAAHPHDTNVSQALKNVAARQTMREGGYDALQDGTGSYRDILKDKQGARVLEQENRQVKSTDVANELIQDYEARLAKEPNDRRLLRSIAELYAQKKDFDSALKYYAQISTIEGQADPALDKAIAQIKIRRIEHQSTLLDPVDPEYEAKKAALQKEKDDFQIAEAKRLVEAYPNDLAHRFELGVLLYHSNRIGEAIQEFQKSQNNPHRKIQSLYYLGQSFAKRNMFDLAVRSLQNAISEKQALDDEKKELMYALGCVLEKQGHPDQAIEQFKQIYEVDIGFKDVAAKVDAYYANPA